MNNELCRMTGAEFPLFAFSHCRDVVAAVSRAGGFGVLGGSSFTPESLKMELDWIDAHVDGKPYGIDILIPEHQAVASTISFEQLVEKIPAKHRDFVVALLAKHNVKIAPENLISQRRPPTLSDVGEALMDVAFQHPIRLIANALGIAPTAMIERGRQYGVPVAALVGAKEHAIRQVNAGVDIIVAQGGEAGGHCGEVSTLVLVPEVIRAIKPIREVPVLAAGGIMTGQQMAGCMAMGAQGAWTGSIWLATNEAETSETFRQKMLQATSRDTIRSTARTGKPSRQLRSAWHDAWEGSDSPGALPMPLMPMLSSQPLAAVDRAADSGNPLARELVTYFVGQGVGLVDSIRSSREVVETFKLEFADAFGGLCTALEE
ncbi:NAD(P)H-dependent flavin oxidoreductase YrpB, nitropropane dioxygenase family [Pseudomonas sp. 9AZ]|uniref:nitronate monooxygenase n=1 Tax=Pseudomonas sp. 9AZ TaxID=2653168 RepID=UPI0012F3E469|nr:nitronate monooxygenase [Pseudomonas sp. 9AZ]VXD04274.1 NAD(P)H-dependent flavin oxidoreductase YrpB, nitropropane dioxygenase family [Pseudomonas sp. 9AZ]